MNLAGNDQGWRNARVRARRRNDRLIVTILECTIIAGMFIGLGCVLGVYYYTMFRGIS